MIIKFCESIEEKSQLIPGKNKIPIKQRRCIETSKNSYHGIVKPLALITDSKSWL